jgi:hypothetical protein
VTDKITFPTEPNVPPTIYGASPADPGHFIWIDTTQRPMWTMVVKIRDENVLQPLMARWRLVKIGDLRTPFKQSDIPPSGVPERDLTFSVGSDRLLPSTCDRLDLAVSGEFYKPDETADPKYFDDPRTTDDLAEVSWLVFEGSGEAADAKRLLDSCPDPIMIPMTGQGTAQ